jgi:thymidine kinase
VKELRVYVGPVHSEKSTKAGQAARRYKRLKHDVRLLRPFSSIRPKPHPDYPDQKPSLEDGRFDPTGDRPGMLVTKSGFSYPSVDYNSLSEIEGLAAGADVVWLDEVMLAAATEPTKQGAVFEAIQRIRREAIVIISALSASSEMEPFTLLMGWLLAVADEVKQCRADCDVCGRFNAATRSICLQEKDGQVLVGGEESYEAACPECWTQHALQAQTV